MPLSRVVITDPPVELPKDMPLPPFRERNTRGGLALFREIRIQLWNSPAVRRLWAENKLGWVKRGWQMTCTDGAWFLQQWLRKDKEKDKEILTLTDYGQERLDALMSPVQVELAIPQPEPLVLTPLPGTLEEKLFDYQREPARQLYRAVTNGLDEYGYPGAWDCSDLGTGKTYSSLAAAIATGLEVGVVCPKAVIGTYPKYGGRGSGWFGAFAHFGVIPKFVINYESLRTGNKQWIRKTGNPGRPYEWTVDPQDTILIFDEAHMIRNKSLNRSMALAAIRQRFPLICVSGTMARDPRNLAATGVAVGLHGGDPATFSRFLATHACKQVAPREWIFKGGKEGRTALAAINRAVFPRRGARIRIEDLGDRFPETQILCQSVDTEHTAEIAEAWRAANATLNQLAEDRDVTAARGLAYMKAWHASEKAKIDTLVQMVHEELENDRSVALFVNFTDCRIELMQRLNTRCAIYGGQSQRERDANIAMFQDDKSRVIISNVDAGGVGVSLHDVNGQHARTAIILPTNKAISLGQALGRVHRAGGKSKSRQIIVFAAGTVEEKICERVRVTLSQMATLNDGELEPENVF